MPRRRMFPDTVLFAALVAVALLLRLWRLDADLPDFVEEAIPFRRALEMGGWQTGRPSLDPGFFNYPTLAIYLHLALIRLQIAAGLAFGHLEQAADFWLRCQHEPRGPVLVARLVTVLADLAALTGAWRLARGLSPRTALLAAAIVALAGPMVRTGRLIQVDPLLAALAVWAIERLAAWQAGGGARPLAMAVVLIGLAAGAKYQGGLLVIPLAWALWTRRGWEGLRFWPLLAIGAAAVFVATTPYAVLSPHAFWRDLRYEAVHMTVGHLGARDTLGIWFVGVTLLRELGPLLLLAALAGLANACGPRWRTRPEAVLLLLAITPLLLVTSLARMQAERYLVAFIPLLAVAAALGADRLLHHRLFPAGRTWLVVLAGAAAGLPLLAGSLPLLAARGHTQVAARIWLESHAGPDEIILSEPHTGPVRNLRDIALVQRHPAWSLTSPAARADWLRLVTRRNLRLPLAVSGEVRFSAWDLAGEPITLDIVPHAADLNSAFYHPALLAGVTWVQVGHSVCARHEASPERYPEQLAWYRLLAAAAAESTVFVGDRRTAGPTVTIYRLDQAPSAAALDPLWWTRAVSPDFSRNYEACCVPPAARTGGAPRDAAGEPAAWVRALEVHFEQLYLPFLLDLATAHLETGAPDAARQALEPAVFLRPDLEASLALMSTIQRRGGDPQAAEATLRRGLQARRDRGLNPTLVQLLLADLYREQSRPQDARRLAEAVLGDQRASESRRERARRILAAIAVE